VRGEDKTRVRAQVMDRCVGRWSVSAQACERILEDTLHEERKRLETAPDNALSAAQRARYDALQGVLIRGDAAAQRAALVEVVGAFFDDVVGHFDPRVHALATRLLPVALNGLLRTLSPLRLLDMVVGGSQARLGDQLVLSGHLDDLRALAQRGTIVLTPTHASNLDSVLLGYALHQLGLPPFTYGAGLNLFANPLLGFFMHNLGAYRVDRRKQARLYKDVLKTYAGVSIEQGYHNLFFPGGTRCRSGAVEHKVKLGLLGMGLDAYLHNLRAGRPRPDVFVVPCTLNYQLVLEAETLIRDHLAEQGKSRFIIDDDESTQPKRILDFFTRLFSLESRIHLVIGQPLDVFGNPVTPTGLSLDPRGRVIDRQRYLFIDGVPTSDPQRDAEYTRELGQRITAAWAADTVLQSTQLVSATLWAHLRASNPDLDLYRLLRTGGQGSQVDLVAFYPLLESTLAQCQGLADAGRLRLDPLLRQGDPMAILNDALAHFAVYHTRPALRRRGERLEHVDRHLILYYAHRLRGYDVVPRHVWR